MRHFSSGGVRFLELEADMDPNISSTRIFLLLYYCTLFFIWSYLFPIFQCNGFVYRSLFLKEIGHKVLPVFFKFNWFSYMIQTLLCGQARFLFVIEWKFWHPDSLTDKGTQIWDTELQSQSGLLSTKFDFCIFCSDTVKLCLHNYFIGNEAQHSMFHPRNFVDVALTQHWC